MGDPGGFFDSEAIADDYEWILVAPFEGGPVWRGREGFVEWLLTWTGEFEDWSIQVEQWIDAGDDLVVALTRQSATGRHSGVPVELLVGQVFELEDGRLVRVTNYATHAEALEAAGLRE